VSPRHVVVTGAAGGIGLAVAEAFAARGEFDVVDDDAAPLDEPGAADAHFQMGIALAEEDFNVAADLVEEGVVGPARGHAQAGAGARRAWNR